MLGCVRGGPGGVGGQLGWGPGGVGGQLGGQVGALDGEPGGQGVVRHASHPRHGHRLRLRRGGGHACNDNKYYSPGDRT